MPSGQHSAQAATRLRTAVPNGGPSCSTEPAMCTNAVSGTKQTCVAAGGAGLQLTDRLCSACIREHAANLADEGSKKVCVAYQEMSYSRSDGVHFGKP